MDVSESGTRRWMRVLGQVGKEARLFARALGDRPDRSTRLFVVGGREFEPWHFTAHLSEEARRLGRADLVPTLLRWKIPEGSPSHLAVTVEALGSVSRHETVLVIDQCGEDSGLLERIADARRQGSRIMTLHRGFADLAAMSHETLSVDSSRPNRDFELTQHVVTDLAPAPASRRYSKRVSRTG
jgi:hypothetical protein